MADTAAQFTASSTIAKGYQAGTLVSKISRKLWLIFSLGVQTRTCPFVPLLAALPVAHCPPPRRRIRQNLPFAIGH